MCAYKHINSKRNGNMGVGKQEIKKLNIAMYPWFAFGHIIPFFQLANKFAKRGHKISFFLPNKPLQTLASSNLYPNLITFIPVPVTPVDGLPPGAETTADIPRSLSQAPLLAAFDLNQPLLHSSFSHFQPDIVFFDYASWIPNLARKHQAKSVYYATGNISFFAYLNPQARGSPREELTETQLMQAPPRFPVPGFGLRAYEARDLCAIGQPRRVYFCKMIAEGIEGSDAMCFRSCREMEGPFGDYYRDRSGKMVLWAGPVLPEPLNSDELGEKLEDWLRRFTMDSVVYCALGSEWGLGKEKFQELVLGLELTGLPFLAILKPPTGYDTVESAVPEGFLERTKERGLLSTGWVQQQLILKHPSIGCFVTHCGTGSLSEALVSKCQIVLLPQAGDQCINARLMSGYLRVGVEIQADEENGFFTRIAVSDAIKAVMGKESEVGRQIRANHAEWRDLLIGEGLDDAYINGLICDLQKLPTLGI